MKIQISSRKIRQVLLILFILNIIMLFGTWLYNGSIATSLPHVILRLVTQLDLAAENVPAAWFSSMLLLLVAVAAGCCYLADNQRLPKLRIEF
jgi:hypothetical protein